MKENLQEVLLEGITWKRTDEKDALCYVFKSRKKEAAGKFLLIANGEVSYGKWDYSNENHIWIELWGEKFIYQIFELTSHKLIIKKQFDKNPMTFNRM